MGRVQVGAWRVLVAPAKSWPAPLRTEPRGAMRRRPGGPAKTARREPEDGRRTFRARGPSLFRRPRWPRRQLAGRHFDCAPGQLAGWCRLKLEPLRASRAGRAGRPSRWDSVRPASGASLFGGPRRAGGRHFAGPAKYETEPPRPAHNLLLMAICAPHTGAQSCGSGELAALSPAARVAGPSGGALAPICSWRSWRPSRPVD